MEPTGHQPFRFQEQRQERVYRRLRLIGDGPASFFRDACQMMDSPMSLQSMTHIVGHLLREVESALRAVLKPQVSNEGSVGQGGRHAQEIRSILNSLDIPEDHVVSRLWLRLPGREGLERRAHRDALFAPRPVDEDFLLLWNSFQTILDFVLERFEQTYLDYHQILDELLDIQHPTRADAQRLRNQAPNNLVAYGYFFDRLTSVQWLGALADEGFFRRPTALEREGDAIRFVPWPQARYLARVAPHAPEAVANILLDMASTDNISVLTDLADAVCVMPADHSVRLIELAKQWASGPYAALMLLPERMGRLIRHLADGGYTESALDLTKVVLALKDPAAESGSGPRMRPEGYLSDWEYKEIIRLRLAALVRACGIEALGLLCGLLDQALRIEWSAKEEASAGRFWEDYSKIWRSNLAAADHPGNPDIRDLLVGAVRDAALQIVGDHPEFVGQVVAELEDRHWTIFWRISLDLLREVASVGLSLAFTRLIDQDLASNPGLETEYLELLGTVFAELSSDDQRKIFVLIDAGPDTSDLRDDLDEDWYVRRWRWQMLASIQRVLPPERTVEWQQLSTEFGSELKLRRHGMVTSWVGHPEAVGVEGLRVMPIHEIVVLLGEFEPGDGFAQPSEEDLARELTLVVGTDPLRFAMDIRSFDNVGLLYKAGLLHGFRDGAEASHVFDWGPVLDLCQKIMAAAADQNSQDAASARREVTDLLHSGLALGLDFPFEFRPRVWELLSALIEDQVPSGLSSASSPYEQAINMTRGRAMEVAVHYGVWVYNHTTVCDPDHIFSLDEAPELREALERHLDPEVESSLAVLSVYGAWLPTLHGLDPGWVSEHLGVLFPHGDEGARRRQAIWEAYMCYARLNLSMLNLLRHEYARSIELLGSPNLEEHRKPDEQIGTHLLIFYWHGRLALDEPMLVRFFEIASDKLRSEVLASMGRDLRSGQEPLEDDVVGRLKALWEWRVQVARGGPQSNYLAEMAAFGWTFAAGALGGCWELDHLEATLDMSGQAAVDHLVAERLALVASEHPSETLRCLALMVRGAQEDWLIHHWATDVETILTAALQSDNEEASQSARALIHQLGARGFLQFAKLLENE